MKVRLAGSALALVLALVGGVAGGGGLVSERLTVHDVVRGHVEHGLTPGTLPNVTTPARIAATWCGTATQVDLSPNGVAGHPVHWVYVIPADGQDGLSAFGSAMQTDAETIDAWWRTQDSTRVPRNDLAPFTCGLQLDISTVRMPQSSAQLSPLPGRFGAIFEALDGAGFRSPFTKYVLYYDGPVDEENTCGQGASDSSGLGLAVVYVRACSGVSTAAVAAHELVHTFGAVPRGAPHECPEPNDAHTCDNESDLMNPFIDDSQLSSIALDPGRDDYYGHAGGWSDAQDAPWLVQLDRQVPFALTVSGPGSVAADVPGLQCAQSCTTTWNADTRLRLAGTPGTGAKLVRFAGACGGSSSCNVAVAPGASVSALFAPIVYRLTVRVSGRGGIRSSQSGIACRPRCSAAFPSYQSLRLTATPAKGWRFRAWSGACNGSRRTCTVPMTAPTSARAVFVRA